MARYPQQIVVVGGGMVAHRFVEAMRDRDSDGRHEITVLAEEPRPPYDRVALTSYFTGRDPQELNLGADELWADPLVTLKKNTAVASIDRTAMTVTTRCGATYGYDHLVLATGSAPFVPPVPGHDPRAAGTGGRRLAASVR